MAKGATVNASDSATLDWAALAETLKKMEPARATATMASPPEDKLFTSASRVKGGGCRSSRRFRSRAGPGGCVAGRGPPVCPPVPSL